MSLRHSAKRSSPHAPSTRQLATDLGKFYPPDRVLSQEDGTVNHIESVSSAPTAETTLTRQRSWQELSNRVLFSMIMAYIFLVALSVGVYAAIIILIVIEVTMFKEITRIGDTVYSRKRSSFSVIFVKWYFLFVVVMYPLLYNLRKPLSALSPTLDMIFSKLPFVGFCSVVLGVIFFVLTLQKGLYRYQFIHFTWTIMTAMFICTQSAAEINNMMRGMIWFLLPVSCVIINDIWAYLFGKFFGRTRLLKLSPKKTVEGFVGALVATLLWSYWFAGFLSYFPEMHCPVESLIVSVSVRCTKNEMYVMHDMALPEWIRRACLHYVDTIRMSEVQQHALVLGVFASLVAPFGGFFASGLKRAYKVKDFGQLIPGHGGMTDRMDCQGLMGLCTYFYLRTYVFNVPKCPYSSILSVDKLSHCMLMLDTNTKRQLIDMLTQSLQQYNE